MLLPFALSLGGYCVSARADQSTNTTHPSSVFKMRLDEIRAGQKATPPQLLTPLPPFKATLPPYLAQANTNLQETNYPETEAQGTNLITPSDAMEKWLLQKISDIKGDLQKTNLNPVFYQSLQEQLWQFRGQLTEHRALVRDHIALAETIRTNRMSFTTNPPDIIGQTMSRSIDNYEKQSVNPGLPPNMRETYKMLAEDRKKQLADHQTNAQLWINLRLAQKSKDTEHMAHAEKELADYLAIRLGKIQGKTYPQGMSLDAILQEYQKQSNKFHWFDRRTVVRTIIFTMFLLPPLVMLFMTIKRRVSK